MDKLFYNDIISAAKNLTLKEAHLLINKYAWKIESMVIFSNYNSDSDSECVWTGEITFVGIPYVISFEEDKYQTILKRFAVLALWANTGE